MALLQEEDSYSCSEENPDLTEGNHITNLAPLECRQIQQISRILKKGDDEDVLLLGFDKADEVDGFEKAGEDYDPPQSGRSLKDESGKNTQGKEEGQIEEDPKEENPEKKATGQFPLFIVKFHAEWRRAETTTRKMLRGVKGLLVLRG